MIGGQVVLVDASKLVLEAFVLMKEKHIWGLAVVEGPEQHFVGNVNVLDVCKTQNSTWLTFAVNPPTSPSQYLVYKVCKRCIHTWC